MSAGMNPIEKLRKVTNRIPPNRQLLKDAILYLAEAQTWLVDEQKEFSRILRGVRKNLNIPDGESIIEYSKDCWSLEKRKEQAEKLKRMFKDINLALFNDIDQAFGLLIEGLEKKRCKYCHKVTEDGSDDCKRCCIKKENPKEEKENKLKQSILEILVENHGDSIDKSEDIAKELRENPGKYFEAYPDPKSNTFGWKVRAR